MLKKALILMNLNYLWNTTLILMFLIFACQIGTLFTVSFEGIFDITIISFLILCLLIIPIKILNVRNLKNSDKEIFYIANIAMMVLGVICLIFINGGKVGIFSKTIVPLIIGISFFILLASHFIFFIRLLFFIYMKKNFPSELINKNSTNINLKKVSSYITLEKQIVYSICSFSTNVLIYISSMYLYLSVLRLLNYNNSIDFWLLKKILEDGSLISLGNLIGILSLTLTVLTITVPVQNRIITDALEVQKEKFNNKTYKEADI